MIVDASAMITVSLEEPGFQAYLDLLLQSTVNRMSAASFLEAAIVVDRLPNPRASIRFNELINELDIIIEPVTVEQARIARKAHSQFGRGTGHRAKLNYGDCFAYALAKELDEPLLFIGNDFIHADIRPALPTLP